MRPEDLISTIEVRDHNGRVVGGRDIVEYPVLLNRAHDEGLKRIETSIVQLPSEANAMTAVAQATVETTKGVFSCAGEASPGDTAVHAARRLVSLAETRAKTRALGDAVNVGAASIQDFLGDATDGGVTVDAAPAELERGVGGPFTANATSRRTNGAMTEAQRRFLFRLLAERKIKGDTAQAFLLQAFGAERLKDVSRAQASALIDKLQEAPA